MREKKGTKSKSVFWSACEVFAILSIAIVIGIVTFFVITSVLCAGDETRCFPDRQPIMKEIGLLLGL